MFTPKTERIEKLAQLFPKVISEIENIFDKPSHVYIDWQNVIHWQEKLGWHFHLERMKQFFDSFDTIQSVKIYTGTLDGNPKAEEQLRGLEKSKYLVTTKPVKFMKLYIDVSSIPKDSPAILKNFLKKSFLSKIDIETVEFLNGKLALLNKQGILYFEEPKCNFDVELGMDVQRDFEAGGTENFVLWSTDGDFADPIGRVMKSGKKVVVFALGGMVAPEIGESGCFVVDVRKIKEFICWPKELPQSIKTKIGI